MALRWHRYCAALLLVLAASCDSLEPPEAAFLEIRGPTSTVAVRATIPLEAVALDGAGIEIATTPLIAWSSDRPNVAAVDAQGLVTGLSIGTALIRARTEGLDATLAVEVTPARVVVELVQGPAIPIPSEQFDLQASMLDATGQRITQNIPVSWQSQHTSIAAIQSGAQTATVSVAAAAPGMTSLTATVGGVTGHYVVAIIPERLVATGISVSQFQVVEVGLASNNYYSYAPELQILVATPGILLHRFEIMVPGLGAAGPTCQATNETLASGTRGLFGRENNGGYRFALFSPSRLSGGDAAATITYTENGALRVIAMRGPMASQSVPTFHTDWIWDDCD